MTKNKRNKLKKSTQSKRKSQGRPRKTSAKRPTNKTMHPLLYEIIGLLMIAIAIIMAFQLGPVGRLLTSFSMYLVGSLYGFIPIILIVQAIIFMVKRKATTIEKRYLIGSIFTIVSFLLLNHIYFFKDASTIWANQPVLRETWDYYVVNQAISLRADNLGGGFIGALLLAVFNGLFETTGAAIAGVVILAIGLILLTGKALVPYLAKAVPSYIERVKSFIDEKRLARKSKEPKEVVVNRASQQIKREANKEIRETAPIISAFTENVNKLSSEQEQREEASIEQSESVEKAYVTNVGVTGEEANESYQLPSTDLLIETPYNDQSAEYDSIQANATKLESTFQSFGVKAKVTQVHLGPAVTKYEILPDTGVKVSRIVSLTDDIALALAASGIRIEAPIPGKSAIGIEVPNKHVAMVSLREVIEAKENNRPEDKLLVSLGRDVTGEAMLAHLNKMPHMLIAGATGSGKSVCINGIIVSLLLRAKPHEVKMMMIDPKMVELNVYNGIPHLLAPVVTDPRKAAQALQKVVSEMERRYELFSHTGTRNLEGYNAHIDEWNEANDEKHPQMPYIVVIVDELADLMMVASNDVEDSITRLAQMARAAGIHLIIATQRPSVDVITGVIKANIPSRIAFAVSSAVDSRTIIDGNGAEKLLGRGDMLYLPPGSSKPVRVQGAFVSDQEVEDVVNFVIEQQKVQYQEEMIPHDVVEVPAHEETDELYEEAVQLVIEMQTASVSFLQRRFRIGYSRAARIVDQMEMRGVVGPPDGSRPRKVLMHKRESESEE